MIRSQKPPVLLVMRANGWRLAKPDVLRRASVYDGGATRVGWLPDPGFPEVYPTNVEAKRAWIVAMEPDLRGASDDFIKAHFNSYSRNLGQVKVLRVQAA